jgi:hypothetical protein
VRYGRPGDLGVVTSYFNPCRFRTRARNFEHFAEPILAANIPLVIVEAWFDDQGPTLDPRYESRKVPARDLMWQKERLLDLGAAWLPPHCTKVAWLDADVLFESEDWALETSARLETSAVVQPFAEAVRLSRDAVAPAAGDLAFESFAAVHATRPEVIRRGRYEDHGHTGFAWAAQRDLIARHGLYDACIAGSADHVMAHAFTGDWESPCVTRNLGRGGRHLAHFRRWCRRVHEEVRGQLAFTPGRLFHMWHGTMENRRYSERNRELHALGFNPDEDIRISSAGAWEWATDKPELHAWSRRYFADRKEDDDAP